MIAFDATLISLLLVKLEARRLSMHGPDLHDVKKARLMAPPVA